MMPWPRRFDIASRAAVIADHGGACRVGKEGPMSCKNGKRSRSIAQYHSWFSSTVFALGAAGLFGGQPANAQSGSAQSDASGIYKYTPRPGDQSAKPPSGPGKSRLKLIDPSVLPIGGPEATQGVQPGGTPGWSGQKSGSTGGGLVSGQSAVDGQAYGS